MGPVGVLAGVAVRAEATKWLCHLPFEAELPVLPVQFKKTVASLHIRQISDSPFVCVI